MPSPGDRSVAKSPKQNFDDLLSTVGSFGRYQKLVAFLVILPAVIPSGFLSMTSVFLAATPADFWCAVPATSNSQFSELEYNDHWVPRMNQNLTKTCKMYLNSTESLRNNGSINSSVAMDCPDHFGFDFDESVYISTIVTEWDLVCDRRTKATWTMTIYTLGGVAGPLFWGFLADRIGRKKGFFFCVAFQSVFTIATAFAPGYIWFCVFRFFTGATTSAGYTVPFVLLLEITGPENRAFFSVLLSFTYSAGSLLFLAIAYYVREWRQLALVSALSSACLYLVVWWFFPESPRWLLSRGKYDDLKDFLLKLSRINRRPVSADFVDSLPATLRSMDTENHSKEHSVIDLFKTRNMRKKTLILVFLNICNKGVSLGLNYYAPLSNPNSPHWSAFLNSVVELPPYLFAKTAFNRLGRRLSLFLGLMVGALACLATYAVPVGLTGPVSIVLLLTLVTKFCITFTYLGGKLFEDEIFPTVVRSEGHSLVSVLSSSISCGVPFVVALQEDFKILPLLVFGSLCFVAALSVFFLPETAHQRLPQTLADGENFGKNLTWNEMLHLLPRKASLLDASSSRQLEPLYPSLPSGGDSKAVP